MTNRVALISGSGSGIGRAISISLINLIDSFVLVGRELEKLQHLGRQLQECQRSVDIIQADLAAEADLLRLGAFIKQRFQRLDILVHSAGGIKPGSVEETTVGDLDWHYSINLRAPFLLTQMSLPLLRAASGQIVFINSSAGLNAKPQLSAYCATKFALKAFADSLRAEENGNGVRVLSVYPGRTATPMQQALYEKGGRTYLPDTLLQPDDVACAVVTALALPRTAELTELMIRGMSKP